MVKDNVTEGDFGGGEIERWGDKAMYGAAPLSESAKGKEAGEITPQVTLLWMTPDPLGAIAATCMMYEGKVVYDLSDVTDDERRHYFEQVQKTHLQAPFEFVQFHFLVEGVTRAFTHQMVRQRTATYAQESLRFAVKEHIDEEVALPPSLRSLPADHPRRILWQIAINKMEDTYHALVADGVPAEDARGLLPHSITTRLHYRTNLRDLLEHGGNRLCTQAQFEWRAEFTSLVNAIRTHQPRTWGGDPSQLTWQFELLAGIFRPICYLTGKCEFNAAFDRACSIRERVNDFNEHGVPSSRWNLPLYINDEGGTNYDTVKPIHPAEWLMDPAAAR